MLSLALWWGATQLFALVVFPLTRRLFRNLPDKGYALSKPLGLLLLGYLSWLAGSAHVLPQGQLGLGGLLLLLGLFSWVGLGRRQAFSGLNWHIVLTSEMVFTLAFFLFAWFRAYNPDISLSGEKYMDFAFLNATLRSSSFPPQDPWLSGYTLNYYYFGYHLMAVVAKLMGTAPAVAYNLSLALLFTLSTSTIFCLAYNLIMLNGSHRKAIGFGLVAIFLLLILGNLEGVLEFLYAHHIGSPGFWQWIGIQGLEQAYSSPTWQPTEPAWWWRASRVIATFGQGQELDYTINEFPFFSFLFGDLHPHLMALPFSLLALGFCLNLYLEQKPVGWAWLKANWLFWLMALVSLGALGPLHSWNLPVFAGLFLLALALQAPLSLRLGQALALAIFSLLGMLLLYLPFYLTFRSPTLLVLPWLRPDTRYLHFFIVWGLPLFIGLTFIISRLRRGINWSGLTASLGLLLLPFLLWAFAALFASQPRAMADKLFHLLPWLAALSIGTALVLKEEEKGVRFGLLLILWGLFLTYIPELFYVLDIHGTRMNTVFRLYYQAWLLLSLGSALALYHLLTSWHPRGLTAKIGQRAWWALLTLLFLGAALYPLASPITITQGFSQHPTLDGLNYFSKQYPGELKAIDWLREQPGVPVVVEAIGGDYSPYSRVSAFTGLPTILGWEEHEWQWRGSRLPLKGRREDIDRIYTSGDEAEVKALLTKYNVSYVFLGHLERAKYGWGLALERFLPMAYAQDGVAIYRAKD